MMMFDEEIETHMIDKPYCRVVVCGRFIPADVAIKIRKKMKRRVAILEIQELGSNPNDQTEQQMPPPPPQAPPFLPQPA